jgi:hypothetical protein
MRFDYPIFNSLCFSIFNHLFSYFDRLHPISAIMSSIANCLEHMPCSAPFLPRCRCILKLRMHKFINPHSACLVCQTIFIETPIQHLTPHGLIHHLNHILPCDSPPHPSHSNNNIQPFPPSIVGTKPHSPICVYHNSHQTKQIERPSHPDRATHARFPAPKCNTNKFTQSTPHAI